MVKVDFLFYREEYAGTIIPDATSLKHPLLAVFTAIVQGILVAGLSTYVNQVIKQVNKTE